MSGPADPRPAAVAAEDTPRPAAGAAEDTPCPPPAEDGLRLIWRNTPEALYTAAQAADVVQKAGRRRNFYMGVLVLLVVFFLPDMRLDGVTYILGGVLLLAAAGGVAALLRYGPAKANRKFAQKKAATAPEARMLVTGRGFSLQEGEFDGWVAFAQDKSCQAAESQGIVALCYQKNRLSAIPLDRLAPGQAEQLRAVLRQGLGDRFQQLD